MHLKKLGLIGGIGPESTIEYYKGIVYGVQKRLAFPFFPNICIESLSVFEVLKLCNEKNYTALADYMASGIKKLEAAGADFVALTGNTPHIVFNEIEEKVDVPVISIVDAACCYAQKGGFKRLGLLGTGVTMESDFFKKPFIEKGIDVVLPLKTELNFLAEKIATEIELGVINPKTQMSIVEMISRMKMENSIDCIALACTELPVVLKGVALPVPCLDTMRIHVDKLIDMILE